MASQTQAAPRWRWHPVAGTSGIAVAATIVAGVRLVHGGSGAVTLAGWLLMGVAAGFATSGSV
jgi:hypothetical protein